jgi:predicted AAA+ superfamily ATPase
MFLRPISNTLVERLDEPRRFIQALIGPRKTGKTTIARQIVSKTNTASHYASADEPVLRDRVWIEQQIACTQHRPDVRSFNSII